MVDTTFTANSLLRNGRAVILTCDRCRHAGEIDLLALQVVGKGDLRILDLFEAKAFACSACGGKSVSLRVE